MISRKKKAAAKQVRYKKSKLLPKKEKANLGGKKRAVQTLAMTAGLLVPTPKSFFLISVNF